MAAWVWFVGAVLLSIAEMLGGEFVLLMIAGGALAGSLTAVFTDALWVQLLVFALTSVVLVVGLRPQLKKRYLKPSEIKTGMDAVIGSKAVVISTVDDNGGQVKIGGEVWTAIGVDGHRPLTPGTQVTVVEVRGATAVVIWGP